MNEILKRVDELNEVLNNGYGVPNMEWVKTKVVELQNVVKENCTIPDVSISLERAKKYAEHQHYRGTINEPLVEFEEWEAKD